MIVTLYPRWLKGRLKAARTTKPHGPAFARNPFDFHRFSMQVISSRMMKEAHFHVAIIGARSLWVTLNFSRPPNETVRGNRCGFASRSFYGIFYTQKPAEIWY
jgi:hypothetical protein